MKEKKNIDRLFQEKLKDFEVHPQPHVWDHLEANLNQKEKDRKVIPIWWRLAGVAAALVVMLGIGFNIWNRQNSTSVDTIVNQDTNILNDEKNSPSESISSSEKVAFEDVSSDQIEQKSSTTQSGNSENAVEKISNNPYELVSNDDRTSKAENKSYRAAEIAQSNTEIENKGKPITESVFEDNKASTNPTRVAETSSDEKETVGKSNLTDVNEKSANTAIAINQSVKTEKELEKDILTETLKEEKSIEEAIAELEELTNEKEKETLNRWRISPNVAPVYFNSLGEGSNIHSQFNENGKTSNINMSYGIAASYAVSKKLKIRTGVSNVNLDYRTNDVMTATGLARSATNSQVNIPNIKLNQNAGASNFMSSKAVSLSSAPEIIKSNMAALEQQFGFIEVPLELEYSLVDKKLGLNVIGGFSTFFLNDNNLFLIDQSGTSLIGESANLNDVSYSANFGLGMFYNFSKAFQFNLEPMFKYQINTFNNTSGDFQPFFMGVYTGLSFKF
jgi:hypothetical protein